MKTFLSLSFIFVLGCSFGYIIELIFRRVVHKKWINPGFLSGPCLPIYGTGVVVLYLICSMEYPFISSPAIKTVFIIAGITVSMTVIEYLTGLFFVKIFNVRLWDYSDRWGNLQGIICPLFSFIWGAIGAAYYFLLHPAVTVAAEWISANPEFAVFVGMYLGVFFVDIGYSFNIVAKMKRFAEQHKILVRFEEVKLSIRLQAEKLKKRSHFIFAFLSPSGLKAELESYRERRQKARSDDGRNN